MIRASLSPLAAMALVATFPAVAGETAWHEIGPGSTLRIISSDSADADGLVWAALDIRLAPGTKTYWRNPGETGIPVTVEVAAGTDAEIVAVDWPLPRREFTGDYMDYVFYDRLVLPFAIADLETTQALDFVVRLGLCSEICVPVDAEIAHTIAAAQADAAQTLRIQQARALAPIAWDGAQPTVSIDPVTEALEVSAVDPAISVDSLIAELDGSTLLYGPPQRTGDGTLRFEPLGRGDVAGSDAVRLSFSTPQGAYHLIQPLSP